MSKRLERKSNFRPKFSCNRLGKLSDFLSGNGFSRDKFIKMSSDLADVLWKLELTGVMPIIDIDGRIAGNGGFRLNVHEKDGQAKLARDLFIVVSKTGKAGGKLMDPIDDVCIVTNFNYSTWSVDFYSEDEGTLPTSDTPLYFTSLMHKNSVQHNGTAILHGHAICTPDDGKKLNLPFSPKETPFSTIEDSDALLKLLDSYAYPANKIFIRNGHGFIIIGENISDCLKEFQKKILPFVNK